ncbi:MAG: SusD/RagB family nutrient-binding outer membrane lipoprotein [Chitinophagaceae bacterium]|nr:SusD/RagB family nutrient-binding outer membrane lipoprotein [Chitinophagaceae bacterium]
MKNKLFIPALAIIFASLVFTACQKGDLLSNPNVAAENSTVPASLILNHITSTLQRGEDPIIADVWKHNQNIVSNYQYYFGLNFYNWSNTGHTYDIVRYCNKMEEQAFKQYNNKTNAYYALSKFFKAHSFVWLSERVGDIPMYQAGDPNVLQPAYDSQKEVFKNALNLLDTANNILGALISTANANTKLDAAGDIYALSYSQWQKVINTYKLRVLISLSKRADDNADLNVKAQFAAIIANPAKYPIMTSNSDNMQYVYNSAYNQYPINRAGYVPYGYAANPSKTLIDLLTVNQDPRLFAFAVPAPAQLAAGKAVGDFSAYIGSDVNLSQATLSNNSTAGQYSFLNWNRYFSSAAGANCEPYIFLGYPEMCFNIAEAANRGWVTGINAVDWYLKGINASMGVYKLTQGQTFTIGNLDGTKPNMGSTTIDIAGFLAQPGVVYAGDNATGLNQILTQKYVAFFSNSGYQAFYNQRRTGVPAFAQGGIGIGTPNNLIPVRWLYPQDEINYNNANYTSAVTAQYGGSDNVNAKMWLIK